jgi:hypothetical protein
LAAAARPLPDVPTVWDVREGSCAGKATRGGGQTNQLFTPARGPDHHRPRRCRHLRNSW